MNKCIFTLALLLAAPAFAMQRGAVAGRAALRNAARTAAAPRIVTRATQMRQLSISNPDFKEPSCRFEECGMVCTILRTAIGSYVTWRVAVKPVLDEKAAELQSTLDSIRKQTRIKPHKNEDTRC